MPMLPKAFYHRVQALMITNWKRFKIIVSLWITSLQIIHIYVHMYAHNWSICNVMDVEIKPTMTMLKSKKKRVHSAKKRAKTVLSQNIPYKISRFMIWRRAKQGQKRSRREKKYAACFVCNWSDWNAGLVPRASENRGHCPALLPHSAGHHIYSLHFAAFTALFITFIVKRAQCNKYLAYLYSK